MLKNLDSLFIPVPSFLLVLRFTKAGDAKTFLN